MRRETRSDARDTSKTTRAFSEKPARHRGVRRPLRPPDLAREAPEAVSLALSAQGTMAAVEYNVYEEKTMSIMVNGEPGTDQAAQFLKDKLCEQGLKGASVPTSSIARTDSFIPSNFPRVPFLTRPPSRARPQSSRCTRSGPAGATLSSPC